MQATQESHRKVLQLVYSIVKNDPYPLKYIVHPRELILRSMQEWSEIQISLQFLANEGDILTRQVDSLQISLTEQGLRKCRNSQEG